MRLMRKFLGGDFNYLFADGVQASFGRRKTENDAV